MLFKPCHNLRVLNVEEEIVSEKEWEKYYAPMLKTLGGMSDKDIASLEHKTYILKIEEEPYETNSVGVF